MTIPMASMIGPQASNASARTARQWASGAGVVEAPGLVGNCRCWEIRYRSRERIAAAAAIIPVPARSNKYLKRTITLFLVTWLGMNPDRLKCKSGGQG